MSNATLKRILLLVAAICFLLAAFVFGGAKIVSSTGWQWVAGGLSAAALSGAVP